MTCIRAQVQGQARVSDGEVDVCSFLAGNAECKCLIAFLLRQFMPSLFDTAEIEHFSADALTMAGPPFTPLPIQIDINLSTLSICHLVSAKPR